MSSMLSVGRLGWLAVRSVFREEIAMYRELFVGVLFSTRTAVSRRQVVMYVRILRLQSSGSFQRRNRFRVLLQRNQSRTQLQECIPETNVQLRGPGKMRHGLPELLITSGQYAEHKFCPRVRRINFKFLLKMLFRSFLVGGCEI